MKTIRIQENDWLKVRNTKESYDPMENEILRISLLTNKHCLVEIKNRSVAKVMKIKDVMKWEIMEHIEHGGR